MQESKTARVVVTGYGVVSPLGNDVVSFWNNLIAGQIGIGEITLFDSTDFATHLAAEVKNFDPLTYMSRYDMRRADRNVQLAVGAAAQAVEMRSRISMISNL